MTGDRYLIYKNQEWKISNSDRLNNGMVRIVSYNKSDLKNGFLQLKVMNTLINPDFIVLRMFLKEK